eukprot:1322889-Prymnesium_polylepis.1
MDEQATKPEVTSERHARAHVLGCRPVSLVGGRFSKGEGREGGVMFGASFDHVPYAWPMADVVAKGGI